MNISLPIIRILLNEPRLVAILTDALKGLEVSLKIGSPKTRISARDIIITNLQGYFLINERNEKTLPLCKLIILSTSGRVLPQEITKADHIKILLLPVNQGILEECVKDLMGESYR